MLEDMASYMSFPTTHGQCVGSIRANAALLAEADFALTIGVEFTQIGGPNELPYLPKPINVAVLSVDRLHLTKQLRPDIALSGHPAPSLRSLSNMLRTRVSASIRDQRLAHGALLRRQRQLVIDAVRALDRNQSPVPPAQIIEEVRKMCRHDWIIMQVASTAGFHFDSIYEMDNPRDFHGLSGKASAQGWGVPAAIGIQLAAPERRVLALVGDGNLLFSAPSIWEAVKNQLPMVFVITNNSGWVSVIGGVRQHGEISPHEIDTMGWAFGDAPIDFVGFARSLGLEASRAATAAELERSLAEAASSKKPWLIDVVTARE